MVQISNKTVYAVTTERRGRTHTYVGTLEHLVNNVFGYTIECNGYDKYSVKSLTTLLKYLNGGQSYWSIDTYYEGRKATKEEIANANVA
ncbi:MAG: hypothetical protein NC218_01990 [Acetobacter sp.]|nr:hypothetical protein [Acetobacter sp.]